MFLMVKMGHPMPNIPNNFRNKWILLPVRENRFDYLILQNFQTDSSTLRKHGMILFLSLRLWFRQSVLRSEWCHILSEKMFRLFHTYSFDSSSTIVPEVGRTVWDSLWVSFALFFICFFISLEEKTSYLAWENGAGQII